MIRLTILISICVFSVASFSADSIKCELTTMHEGLDQNNSYGFLITLKGFETSIQDMGYFSRTHSPCPNTRLSSCNFEFKTDSNKPFQVMGNTGSTVTLTQQWWFSSELQIDFAGDYEQYSSEEKFPATISGFDGSSTEIINDALSCQRI